MNYSKIVFGLKHHQKLYDCQRFIELVDSLRIIISEHNASTDDCERPGLHYHGIIEHENVNVDDSEAILVLKTHCAYFKIEKCNSPEQYIGDLVNFPKKVMINEIKKSVNLSAYYAEAPIHKLELGHFEKEKCKKHYIELIIKYVLGKRISDPEEIWKQIKVENHYCAMLEQFKDLIPDAIVLSRQKIQEQPILELCGTFFTPTDNYYDPEESVRLVVEWCRYQNIDLQEWTMNLINCFNREVNYKNSLYLQGSTESGVLTVINSIAEACMFVGKINEETTGFAYVWEDCLDKRVIIMRDPVFDDNMFQELGDILKGIGTLVPHRQTIVEYLRPTPVVIISSKNDWESDLYLHRLQDSFLKSYMNLKPFLKLHNDPRLLHPYWLNAMYENFSGRVNNEDSEDTRMSIDSSFESSDEKYSTVASVSSSPFVASNP